VTKGPVGRVPKGVAKPNWYIDTSSTTINTDLSTPEGVIKKLRQAAKTNSPRWTIPKGLNTTFTMPSRPRASGTPVSGGQTSNVPVAGGETVHTVVESGGGTIANDALELGGMMPKASMLRVAGEFLSREVPNAAFLVAIEFLFPPHLIVNNDNAEQLYCKTVEPALEHLLSSQDVLINKMVKDDPEQWCTPT
jgi:hypothetical protein